jgi:hypothetical protein
MFAFDIVFTAWLAVALAALVVPLVFLIAEWTFKPLSDWVEETEETISSQSGPITSTRLN